MVLVADHDDHPPPSMVCVPAAEDLIVADMKIALTGAAGLVGQNLIPRLNARGYGNIVALDKHKANIAILRRLHPDIAIIETDLAHDNGWQGAVADPDVVVLSHSP